MERQFYERGNMPQGHAIAEVHERINLLGNLLALSFGILFIVGGVLGRRFTVGLSGKTTASPWYGRGWLIGNGLFLLAAGGVGLLRVVHPQTSLLERPEFWNKAQGIFFAVFESYNGVVVAVVGLVASVYFFRKQEWKLFWLCLAFIAGGSIFGYDGVWTLIKGR